MRLAATEQRRVTVLAACGFGDGGCGACGVVADSCWSVCGFGNEELSAFDNFVSYIGEDVASECGPGGRRKYANLQKKSKWKSVSKVMAERGFCVSPQQCEDKFNDLNKRYKKLYEILGRGTSCHVVENPVVLDMMVYLLEKMKEEVRKRVGSVGDSRG
ncbi:hypothetical protein Drorol1_Dr00027514 [Drosera rotundifolia]